MSSIPINIQAGPAPYDVLALTTAIREGIAKVTLKAEAARAAEREAQAEQAHTLRVA